MPIGDPPQHCEDCLILAERVKQVELRMIDRFDAADLRYQQRFQAQTEAVNAAFLAQQTAMQTALSAAEKAVAAALAASDRAVTKAELAADKRFEAGNEIKQAMAEQGTKMATRAEVDQRVVSVLDKIEGTNGISQRLVELTRRMDNMSGRESSQDEIDKNAQAKGQWLIGLVIVGILTIGGWAITIFSLLTRK